MTRLRAPREPGRRVTIKDVAAAAGVALGTASRVINGQSSVRPEVRRRVETAIQRLGYRPDFVARSMRSSATRTIGILVRDLGMPSFAALVSSAEQELQGAGYAVLLACSEDRPDRERRLLELFGQRRMDGLIMTTCDERDRALQRARTSLGMPVVLLDRDGAGTSDSMVLDHAETMAQAVDYLFELGHRRIGLVTGSTRVRPGRERVVGYERAHDRRGVPIDPALIRATTFAPETGAAEYDALFALPRPPTAVIAGGVALLAGALTAIRARGLRIPQDVSLISSGDSDLALLASPPITVIRWSYAELGRTGAQLLLSRLQGPARKESRRVTFATQLVIRDSCAAPRPRR